jgi:hypothetical protein
MPTSGENIIARFIDANADCQKWYARRPPHRRQSIELHHGNLLGLVLHFHDPGLLLHDALPGQRCASRLGDRLGPIDVRSCLGTECGDSVRYALLDRSVRMLLIHGDYLCDRVVV